MQAGENQIISMSFVPLPEYVFPPRSHCTASHPGSGTKDMEMIWFSPACIRAEPPRQRYLFVDP